MGLLDNPMTPEQAEIKRLENLYAQLQLGTVRIEDALAQLGPGDERTQMQAQLAQMQQQATQTGQQLSGMGQAPNAGIGQQLASQVQQAPQMAPQPQTPPAQPQGLLSDPAAAGGGFQPTLQPQAMNELFGIMAAGADDPVQVGLNYAQRMQYNDMLGNQFAQAQKTMTDAQRMRPVGGGFVGETGDQIHPIWNPKTGRMEFQKGPRRLPPTIKVGGVEYAVNPNIPIGQPGSLIPAVDMTTATTNAADLNRAESLGTARGSDQAGAEVLGGEMTMLDKRLASMVNDPNFSGGVGLLDQFTGKVGAQFGTAEGLITKEANYISNYLTRSSVKDWKGAISNAELNFFKSSVPQAGDGPEVWKQWYENVYKPTMAFVNARASGQISKENSDLSTYLGGEPSNTGTQLDDETQALVNKYTR